MQTSKLPDLKAPAAGEPTASKKEEEQTLIEHKIHNFDSFMDALREIHHAMIEQGMGTVLKAIAKEKNPRQNQKRSSVKSKYVAFSSPLPPAAPMTVAATASHPSQAQTKQLETKLNMDEDTSTPDIPNIDKYNLLASSCGLETLDKSQTELADFVSNALIHLHIFSRTLDEYGDFITHALTSEDEVTPKTIWEKNDFTIITQMQEWNVMFRINTIIAEYLIIVNGSHSLVTQIADNLTLPATTATIESDSTLVQTKSSDTKASTNVQSPIKEAQPPLSPEQQLIMAQLYENIQTFFDKELLPDEKDGEALKTFFLGIRDLFDDDNPKTKEQYGEIPTIIREASNTEKSLMETNPDEKIISQIKQVRDRCSAALAFMPTPKKPVQHTPAKEMKQSIVPSTPNVAHPQPLFSPMQTPIVYRKTPAQIEQERLKKHLTEFKHPPTDAKQAQILRALSNQDKNQLSLYYQNENDRKFIMHTLQGIIGYLPNKIISSLEQLEIKNIKRIIKGLIHVIKQRYTIHDLIKEYEEKIVHTSEKEALKEFRSKLLAECERIQKTQSQEEAETYLKELADHKRTSEDSKKLAIAATQQEAKDNERKKLIQDIQQNLFEIRQLDKDYKPPFQIDNSKKDVIEFQCNSSGLEYRLDHHEPFSLIPWDLLSENFPRDAKQISSKKDTYLPEIFIYLSLKDFTPLPLEEFQRKLWKDLGIKRLHSSTKPNNTQPIGTNNHSAKDYKTATAQNPEELITQINTLVAECKALLTEIKTIKGGERVSSPVIADLESKQSNLFNQPPEELEALIKTLTQEKEALENFKKSLKKSAESKASEMKISQGNSTSLLGVTSVLGIIQNIVDQATTRAEIRGIIKQVVQQSMTPKVVVAAPPPLPVVSIPTIVATPLPPEPPAIPIPAKKDSEVAEQQKLLSVKVPTPKVVVAPPPVVPIPPIVAMPLPPKPPATPMPAKTDSKVAEPQKLPDIELPPLIREAIKRVKHQASIPSQKEPSVSHIEFQIKRDAVMLWVSEKIDALLAEDKEFATRHQVAAIKFVNTYTRETSKVFETYNLSRISLKGTLAQLTRDATAALSHRLPTIDEKDSQELDQAIADYETVMKRIHQLRRDPFQLPDNKNKRALEKQHNFSWIGIKYGQISLLPKTLNKYAIDPSIQPYENKINNTQLKIEIIPQAIYLTRLNEFHWKDYITKCTAKFYKIFTALKPSSIFNANEEKFGLDAKILPLKKASHDEKLRQRFMDAAAQWISSLEMISASNDYIWEKSPDIQKRAREDELYILWKNFIRPFEGIFLKVIAMNLNRPNDISEFNKTFEQFIMQHGIGINPDIKQDNDFTEAEEKRQSYIRIGLSMKELIQITKQSDLPEEIVRHFYTGLNIIDTFIIEIVQVNLSDPRNGEQIEILFRNFAPLISKWQEQRPQSQDHRTVAKNDVFLALLAASPQKHVLRQPSTIVSPQSPMLAMSTAAQIQPVGTAAAPAKTETHPVPAAHPTPRTPTTRAEMRPFATPFSTPASTQRVLLFTPASLVVTHIPGATPQPRMTPRPHVAATMQKTTPAPTPLAAHRKPPTPAGGAHRVKTNGSGVASVTAHRTVSTTFNRPTPTAAPPATAGAAAQRVKPRVGATPLASVKK